MTIETFSPSRLNKKFSSNGRSSQDWHFHQRWRQSWHERCCARRNSSRAVARLPSLRHSRRLCWSGTVATRSLTMCAGMYNNDIRALTWKTVAGVLVSAARCDIKKTHTHTNSFCAPAQGRHHHWHGTLRRVSRKGRSPDRCQEPRDQRHQLTGACVWCHTKSAAQLTRRRTALHWRRRIAHWYVRVVPAPRLLTARLHSGANILLQEWTEHLTALRAENAISQQQHEHCKELKLVGFTGWPLFFNKFWLRRSRSPRRHHRQRHVRH